MLTRNLLDVFGERRLPFAIRRAKGVRVTDVDGRVYLDCLAGANHTAVVSAKYMSDVA